MATQLEAAQHLHAQKEAIVKLVDHASTEPGFLAALAADPFGMAAKAGVRVSAADLKVLLGLPGASDHELLDVIRTRILAAHDASCGCGG
jgi:hypothetical protein